MPFSIGRLARDTGVKVPTIRYYEDIGLLPAAPRTQSNRRTYDRSDVQRLRFIRHARELGFEIESIRQLMQLSSTPEAQCAEADQIAQLHLADIDSRIARLTALREEVARLVGCDSSKIAECRVIEVLADHAACSSDHPDPAGRGFATA